MALKRVYWHAYEVATRGEYAVRVGRWWYTVQSPSWDQGGIPLPGVTRRAAMDAAPAVIWALAPRPSQEGLPASMRLET